MSRAEQSAHPVGWYPILLATATMGLASSVVFALLSNFQDKFGFGDVGLGLIAGAGFVVGLLGQLFFSPFADRGHSKRLLLLGLGISVLGNLAFAFSTSLWMLVASRCIVGVSTSLFLPAARAIVVSIDPAQVSRRLGTLGGVELAGFVTGPMIGGVLVGPFGLKVPFLVTGLLALTGLVLLAPRTLPEPPLDHRHRVAFDLVRLPGVRTGMLLSVASFVPVGFYDATLDRYLTDLGARDVEIGLAFVLFGIPFALLASTGGRIADRYGAFRAATTATLLVVPITLSYGLVQHATWVIAFSAVEGVIQAAGIPAVQGAVARSAPTGRAAAAQGLAGASNLTVGALTAFASGTIYQRFGAEGVFSTAAVGMLVFSALAYWQHRVTRRQMAVVGVS